MENFKVIGRPAVQLGTVGCAGPAGDPQLHHRRNGSWKRPRSSARARSSSSVSRLCSDGPQTGRGRPVNPHSLHDRDAHGRSAVWESGSTFRTTSSPCPCRGRPSGTAWPMSATTIASTTTWPCGPCHGIGRRQPQRHRQCPARHRRSGRAARHRPGPRGRVAGGRPGHRPRRAGGGAGRPKGSPSRRATSWPCAPGGGARRWSRAGTTGWRAIPGLSLACAEWLHDHEIAAVVSDNWGVEVQPAADGDGRPAPALRSDP